MSESDPTKVLHRGYVDAVRTALRNGIQRYKALGSARETRWLLGGFAMFIMGFRFLTIALVVLSYQLGEGVLGVGGLLAIQMMPGILLQAYAGSVVDRYSSKTLLMGAQYAIAIVTLGYLLLFRFESIWLLYLITFVRACITAIEQPAYEVRLVSLTPADKRGTANAVQSLAAQFGEILGPLLGGFLLVLFGAPTVVVISALIFTCYGLLINWLPERIVSATSEQEEVDDDDAAEATALSKAGYRGLLIQPSVLQYLLQVGGSYTMFFGLIPLFIVKALEMNMNEASIGIFYSMIGVGGFLGGIFAGMGEYSTKSALAITGTTAAIGGVSTILFGVVGVPILVFAVLILLGLLGEIEEIPAITYFQNSLPEGVVGRFFSLFIIVSSIGGLVGSLLSPLLADRFTLLVAVTIISIPMIASGVLLTIKSGGIPFRSQGAIPVPAAATAEGGSDSAILKIDDVGVVDD